MNTLFTEKERTCWPWTVKEMREHWDLIFVIIRNRVINSEAETSMYHFTTAYLLLPLSYLFMMTYFSSFSVFLFIMTLFFPIDDDMMLWTTLLTPSDTIHPFKYL